MISKNLSFPLFICIGLVIVLGFSRNSEGPPLLVPLLFFLGAIPGFILFKTYHLSLKRGGFYLIGAALGAWLGVGLYFFHLPGNQSFGYSDALGFKGTVIKESSPYKTGGFIHYISLTEVEKKNFVTEAAGEVMVFVSSGEKLFTGRNIRVKAMIKDDSLRGLSAFCREDQIVREDFSHVIWEFRYFSLSSIEGVIASMGYPAGGLFKALFLGDREGLPEELYENFQKTGSLHLLALSGLHVGILYLFILGLLFFVRDKRVKFGVVSFVILGYLFFAGPGPSLLRASLMLIVFSLSEVLDREIRPLNIMALSAIIILFFDPEALFSLSFQLSYLALLGIFIIGNRLSEWLAPFIPSFLLKPIAFSVSAQIATAPLVLSSFGVLYPGGIIAALVLIPFVTAFLWGGILFLILSVFNLPLLYPLSWLLHQIYVLLIFLTRWLKVIPGLALEWQGIFWLPYLAVFIYSGFYFKEFTLRLKRMRK